MGGETVHGTGHGWAIAEPPNWCRDERRVLLELVPERPQALPSVPQWEMQESLGIELWRAVVNVRQWAEAPKEERPALFRRIRAGLDGEAHGRRAEARAQAPELTRALEAFADLTDAPGAADAGALVLACRAVVQWAGERGLAETAVQFAEAAAAVLPESAALANLAGLTCRTYGQRGRAELWYDRAVGLSRKTPGKRGIRQYVRAHLGIASTLLEIEEHAAALEHIRTAALTAKRKGMKGKAAEAFHDAMYYASMTDRLPRAAFFARKAVGIYPYHHHRYPALAHDVAVLMIFFGMYGTALSILQSAIRKITKPADQVVVWGSLARAAAGAGRVHRFRDAVERVDALAPAFGHLGAAALYSVGEGARLLRLWSMAQQYAAAAAEQARKTGAVQIQTRADQLLADIEARVPGTPELPKSDPRGVVLRRIAPTLRLRVVKWRGPTWRPRQLGPEDLDDY